MVIGAERGAATGTVIAEALRQEGLRKRGLEQALEHVIALSAGAAPSWGEMLRGRLWSDGLLAAAKQENQRQGVQLSKHNQVNVINPIQLSSVKALLYYIWYQYCRRRPVSIHVSFRLLHPQ